MAKKPPKSSEPLPPPNLVEPRDIAFQKIQAQIENGLKIRNRTIRSTEELEEAHDEHSKWSKYNTELLKRLFDNSSMADEYNRFYGAFIAMNPTLTERIEDFRKDMRDSITRLEAIRDRLDLIPEVTSTVPVSTKDREPATTTLQNERARLRQNLNTYFSDTELREICFDLGIDYQELPHEDKRAFVVELITHLDRRGRLAELISVCKQLRPNLSW